MARLAFKDLEFKRENGKIRVNFLKLFYFCLEDNDLKKVGEYKIEKNAINFKADNISHKFNLLLEKGFQDLKNSLNGNRTIYIHKNSGIPLIGSLSFGIVDRGSNMLEIKPITSCSLNCIFCSVGEGLSSKKTVDYVVEKDYLVSELKKLVEYKNSPVDIYINPHGEPLLYADIVDLVEDIAKIKLVKVISIISSGALLTKELIDKLVKAGLNRVNLSLNAVTPVIAKKLAGTADYNVGHVKEMAGYISKKIELFITPVLIPGFNGEEMPKLIEFAKDINAKICIQNFLQNKRGRNPAKAMPMDKFYLVLKELEKAHNAMLIADFKPVMTKELPKPFHKGDIINAQLMCPGRYINEALAAAKGRVITAANCHKKGIVRLRITRDKDNVFYGELA